MGEESLAFYEVDVDYITYLRKFDEKVSINSGDKYGRKFIGVLVKEEKDYAFFAPLSSPKKKHISMKNSIDFLKIKNGIYGVINFNNMIPVPYKNCSNVVFENEKNIEYKKLLLNQYRWCVTNKDLIKNKALKLYENHSNKTLHASAYSRCCNFDLLQLKAELYIHIAKQQEIRERIIEDDKEEIAGIKYISNDSILTLEKLNAEHCQKLSLSQIKELYDNECRKVESGKVITKSFKELEALINDLLLEQIQKKVD